MPVVCLSIHLNASPSTNLDSTFAIGTGAGTDITNAHAVNTVLVQPDGKVLAGGNTLLTNFNGTAISHLLRINVDGSVDTSFVTNLGSIVSGSNPGEIDDIKLQPDGKILIAGDFTAINGLSRIGVARLNTDGSVDTSFINAGGGVAGSTIRYVNTVLLLPNGKMLIGGAFTSYLGTSCNSLARLNSDGTLDASFNCGAPAGVGTNVGILSLGVQGDGKIYVGGSFLNWLGQTTPGVVRLYPNGALDSSFYPTHNMPSPQVNCLQVMADNSILIGGFIELTGTNISRYFAKLNNNGSLDTSYPAGSGINGWVHAITPWPEGGYLIGGRFRDASGLTCGELCLVDGSGNVDTNFALAAWNPIGQDLEHIYAIGVAPDSKIVLGGWFYNYPDHTQLNGVDYGGVARLIGGYTAGAGKVQFVATNITVGESDGTVTVGVTRFGGVSGAATVHYATANGTATTTADYTNTSGTLSWAANEGGVKTFTVPIKNDAVAESLEIFSITLSTPTGAALGTPSTTTVTIIDDDSAPGIVTQPQNATVFLSFPATFTVLPAAGLQPTFQWRSNGVAIANATNGFLLFTNVQTNFAASYTVVLSNTFGAITSSVATLTVLTPAGLPNPVFFSTTNGFNADVYGLAPTPAGFVASGLFSQFGGVSIHAGVAQINLDGTYDNAFNSGNAGISAASAAYALSPYPDGRLLIGGTFTSYAGTNRSRVARLNGNGSLDTSYSNSAPSSSFIFAVAASPDGSAYVGDTSSVRHYLSSGTNDTNFIQLTLIGQPDALALQGDGKIIAAPYRGSLPSGSEILRLNTNGTRDLTFEGPGFFNGQIAAISILPDGLIVIGGGFTNAGGITATRILALQTNGAVDATFLANIGSGPDGSVIDVSAQPDGKILVGGGFATWNGKAAGNYIRLNADGTTDSTFVTGTGANSFVRSIRSDTNGNIAIGGAFTQVNGLNKQGIAILTYGGGSIQFTTSQQSVAENATNAVISVQRVGGTRGAVSVNYFTTAGTATAGSDFTTTSGTLTWTNGDNSVKSFNVLIQPNAPAEPEETFTVGLSNLVSEGSYGLYTNQTVTILDINSAPRITANPTNLVAPEDVNATFSVSAYSPLAFGYQWRSNGVNIASATNASLVLSAIKTNFAASYSVIVSNAIGTITSSNAVLTVIPSPVRLDVTFTNAITGNVRAILPLGDGRALVGGDPLIGSNGILLLNSNGVVDASFTNTAIGSVYDITRDGKGRFLVVGNFGVFAGVAVSNIVRLNPDYTVDKSFLGALGQPPNALVRCVAVGPDGKIWFGGDFTSISAPYGLKYAARFNDNGTLDATFLARANNPVYRILPTTNGGAFLAGSFGSYDGTGGFLRRVNPSGTVDSTWAPSPGLGGIVYDIVPGTNGVIYAAGAFTGSGPHVAKFDATGKADLRFLEGSTVNNTVNAIALQANGKIVAGGAFTSFAGQTNNRFARVLANGYVDANLNLGTGFQSSDILRIALESNGAIWVGGQFTTFKSASANYVVRLVGDIIPLNIGQQPPDRVAGTGLATTFTATAVGAGTLGYQWLKNGGALVDGTSVSGANTASLTVANLSGVDEGSYSLVVTNTSGDSATTRAAVLLVRSGPSILTQPSSQTVPVGGRLLLTVQADGAPALSYQWRQNGTPVGTNSSVFIVTNAPAAASGSYTVVVSNSFNAVTSAVAVVSVQFTPASAVTNFVAEAGTASFTDIIDALAPMADGSILAGGTFTQIKNSGTNALRNNAVLYGTNGALQAFNPNPNGQIFDAVRQADGKILLGGLFNFITTNNVTRSNLARFNADLSFDTAFTNALGTGPNGQVSDIALQPDGKILIAGTFTSVSGVANTRGIARLNADGSVDTNFVSGMTGGSATAVDILPDGRIVFLGNGTTYSGVITAVYRLGTNGAVDGSFGASGNATISCLAVQADGGVLLGGTFTTMNNTNRPALARLNPAGKLDTNFLAGITNVTAANQANIRSIVVQSNGRILVGGNFLTFGPFRNGLARFNADGTPDSTFVFQQGGGENTSAAVYRIALFADGRIAVGGTSLTWEGVTENNLIILTGDAVSASPYDSWATGAGLTGGNSGAGLDPDGDGVPNVFEYYFGTSPTNSSSIYRPYSSTVQVGPDTYPTIGYIRSKTASGVTATVIASSTCVYADSLGTTVQSVTDLGNGTELVVIRSNVSIATNRVQFLKLTLTVP